MAYSAHPGFGNPTIYSKMVLSSNSDGVEIRGGILFKILIVLFKCVELLDNPTIIDFILNLFTDNLQRLEHFKEGKKYKSQLQQAVSDIFFLNKDYSEGNEIEELVTKMSARYLEKFPDDKPMR